MPKKHSYTKLRVDDSLHGRFQLCMDKSDNPILNVATIFGKDSEERENAELLCAAWNAVVSVAKRLNADPLQVAKKLQRGELVKT